jgi:hypothetical protein
VPGLISNKSCNGLDNQNKGLKLSVVDRINGEVEYDCEEVIKDNVICVFGQQLNFDPASGEPICAPLKANSDMIDTTPHPNADCMTSMQLIFNNAKLALDCG